MSRLLFYVLLGLDGAGLVLDGALHGRVSEFVIGLVIALGVQVMLGTGWWLRWEHTVWGHPRRLESLPGGEEAGCRDGASAWSDARPHDGV